ncbi:hypothetical protein J7W19_03620 [Streptomyces mobaraensis NBRC 13819 = DSM 40847]|uniref:Type II toxin-antitoxin system VapC family toxin n=2 Tax=Streptomyces mobaraensis TaxID=35621 RepID=A0A5N5W2L5_STRMB|nr:hypothetical protein [Streptomyces mobaraensis]EMF02190.1 hypothetical protein H340_01779 [Streptomyces mobaraensis NBRC 13819 = DSM 40847]KAB7836918.1 hypothetical protein FRZ00_24410 [Streptomyces mobaraensis]QTT72652.1 hypothetical protein J7W19_03620 [Streptomyces mobaraensis NBRC 13819 = DSM 40847]
MIILDTGAVTALARGHKTLSLLAGNAGRSPGERLIVPATCLMQAEVAEDASRQVLAFSSIAVDSLDTVAAVAVGAMVRDGYGGPDVCHALYCAMPRADFAGLSILLTDREESYPPGVVTVDIDSPGMLGFS